MKYCKDKDVDKLLREIEGWRGWRLSLSGTGHVKVEPPHGTPFYVGRTPSTPRAYQNLRLQLRRAHREMAHG